MLKPNIQPAPGYLLTKPYIKEDKIFKSAKETEGEDQLSTIIAVGEDVLDDNGNVRTSPAKVGQIIIHTINNSPIEIEGELYRFVHFVQTHGVYYPDKRN